MHRRRPVRLLIVVTASLTASLVAAAPAHAAAPDNDDVLMAAAPSFPLGSDSVDTTGATMEAGEQSPCGGIGSTAWYAARFTSDVPLDASVTYDPTQPESTYTANPVLAIYTSGTSPADGYGDLGLVDCNDDEDLLIDASRIELTAKKDHYYYFQVGGQGGKGGALRFRVAQQIGYDPDGQKEPDAELAGATSFVLDNGTVRLGVNDTGNLVARDTWPRVGLTFTRTGYDALSPGCPCEGWGVLDEVSRTHGSVAESLGRTGDLRVLDFDVTGTAEAVSDVSVGNAMRVRHKFRPALGHPGMFEIVVTVTNTTQQEQLPLYRRTMDWDIGPTNFREYVTIAGDVGGTRGTEPKVIYTSDNGFASPDPISGRSKILAEGTFTDSGPADHGALVDIALPKLQPGQSSSFSIFYGAAEREDAMREQLLAAQTAVYSLAKPSSTGALETGEPNTFGFGFRLHDSRYVAIGDSFQSGEGAPEYEPGTDVADVNMCHRSFDAYAHRLHQTEPLVGGRLTFVACSGAVIDDLYDTNGEPSGPPWNEGAQMERLGGDTTLVTIGIGGNDMQFAKILETCIVRWATQKIGSRPCSETEEATFQQLLTSLTEPGPDSELSRLQTTYEDVRARAPRARVLALGYPRFFTPAGDESCGGTRLVDQLWINEKIRLFNERIAENVQAAGMEFVDTFTVGAGHELCSGSATEFMNRVVLPPHKMHSYHPNNFGHELLAGRVGSVLREGTGEGTTYQMQEGQRIYSQVGVAEGTTSLTVGATWPGSDVHVSLLSPSGTIHRRTTSHSDARHTVGPTHEKFTITNPEPGPWTVRLYGAELDDHGEPVVLRVGRNGTRNAPPTVAVTMTQIDAKTVRLDASASTDSDGSIAAYRWDLADGTSATGAVVTHTYSQAGTYVPALTVVDDDGAAGFASTPQDVVVELPRYGFSGFAPPVENEDVNVMNAGRSIPFKWTLADEHGERLTATDVVEGYGFDASGATFALRYDTTQMQYVLVANTPAAWAGQRRTFTLRLDDGSSYAATFEFR